MDVPQNISENSNIDSSSLIAEAQEDIQPQNQTSQETEKEIEQTIYKQSVSETFCKTNTLAHSHREICCTYLESSFVDQNEEGPTDIPICLTDENFYFNKFSNFNQSYDDDDF